MQTTLLQAKLQAGTSLAKAATSAGTRAGLQSIRTQAPSFGKCTNIAIGSRGAASTAAVAEASTPAPTAPERDSQPSTPRRSINDFAFQLKFIIPNALVGAIMGFSGSNVGHIYDITGAFIQATRPGYAVFSSRERMLIIAGQNAKQCKSALRIMLESLDSQGVADKLSRVGQPSNRLFLKQIIPAPCAGKILGPGGDQIAAISAMSGASVVIEAKPNNAAFIPFRTINYMAQSVQTLAAAGDAVADLLEQDDRYAAAIRDITSIAFKVVQIPEKRAGGLLGPGGTYIKALQDMLKVKMGICEGSKPGSRYVAVWGPPTNVNVALDVIAVTTGGLVRGTMSKNKEESNQSEYAATEGDSSEQAEEHVGEGQIEA